MSATGRRRLERTTRRFGAASVWARASSRAAVVVFLVALLAAPLGGSARAVVAAHVESAYSENPNCSDAEFNAASAAGKDCGATLTGPASLRLTPCPASIGGSSYVCSAKFTFSLSVKGAVFCSKPSLTDVCILPGQILASSLSTSSLTATGAHRKGAATGGQLYPHIWTESLGGPFTSESEPQYVQAPYDPRTTPRSFVEEFLMQGNLSTNGTGSGHFVADVRVRVTIGKAAPSPATLAVAVTSAVPGSGLAVGGDADVTAKVTAKGGAVSGISLGKGLTSSSSAVTVASAPSSLSGFSLGKGASRSFRFRVKGEKPGASLLKVDATGKSSSGAAVRGSGSLKLRIGGQALSIAVVTNPSPLKLKLKEDGSIIAGQVIATVTVTNKTKARINGIQLLSVDPAPSDPTQQLDQLAFPRGTFPLKLGSLGPGATSSKKLVLEVTGDGRYQFRALALYDDGAGGNGRATSIGGGFESVVPLLFYSATRDTAGVSDVKGAPYIKAGATWYISAKLKNESSYQHLCILPMAPSFSGNAAATGPTNIAVASVRQFGGPFAGELGPGKKVSLQMFVDTSATGGTASKVSLAPVAVKIAPDGKCRQEAVAGLEALGADEKQIVPASTDFTVHVDTSAPLKGPIGKGTAVFNFFGGIGQSVFVDTFEQVLGLIALNHSIGSTVDHYNEQLHFYPAAIAYTATLKAAQLLYTAGDVYASYWRTATEQEKTNLYFRVGNVIANVTNDFFGNATQEVRESAAPFMDKLEQAYGSGDDAEVWHLWGQLTGHVVQQVIAMVFLESLGAQITKTAPELEAVATKAGEEWEATAAVKGAEEASVPPDAALERVPAGVELKAADLPLWGQDVVADAEFARISKACDCLIGVRGRSPGSIQKLKRGSVWKHENLKPKNVNDIDIDWLGFRKTDLSEVRFRTYTPEQETAIRHRVAAANISADDKAAILDRFETRSGEKQYFQRIEGFSKRGQIDVGFNYRDNGVNRSSTSALRKFDLQSAPAAADNGVPAGGVYYTPFQENPGVAKFVKNGGKLPDGCIAKLLSVLCTVTGDMDGVYVTKLNGGAIPPAEMVKIYKLLQEAGWQHPETLTWINNEGQFFFGAKARILKGLEQAGGEAMIEYAPDGVRRATYLNLSQSSLLSRTDFRLRIVGGYSDYVEAAARN